MKIPEENMGSMLFDIGLSNIFLDLSPETRETKAKINKWNHIKLKALAQEGKPLTKRNGILLNGRI